MSKSKEAPMKQQTMSRLELLVALLGAQLSKYFSKALLPNFQPLQTVCGVAPKLHYLGYPALMLYDSNLSDTGYSWLTISLQPVRGDYVQPHQTLQTSSLEE